MRKNFFNLIVYKKKKERKKEQKLKEKKRKEKKRKGYIKELKTYPDRCFEFFFVFGI